MFSLRLRRSTVRVGRVWSIKSLRVANGSLWEIVSFIQVEKKNYRFETDVDCDMHKLPLLIAIFSIKTYIKVAEDCWEKNGACLNDALGAIVSDVA